MSKVDLMVRDGEDKFETFVKNMMGNCSQVMMKDPSAVFEKVVRIKSDGLEKFQAIIDFDRTISSYCDAQGNKCPTSYRAFMAFCRKKGELSKIEDDLSKIYLPIEFDHSIPEEEKKIKMLDWWKGTNDAILDVKESRESVSFSIGQSGIFIREGFDQILTWLNHRDVPVCVASAGLGDVVKGTIEKYCGKLSNINYASNFFQYNEDDIIVNFSQPLIHSNNKYMIDQCDTYFDKKRTNVLIIGDSVGDCCMADNLSAENVLKIGFLNFQEKDNLDKYLNNFDIVIKSGHSSKLAFPLISFLLDV